MSSILNTGTKFFDNHLKIKNSEKESRKEKNVILLKSNSNKRMKKKTLPLKNADKTENQFK